MAPSDVAMAFHLQPGNAKVEQSRATQTDNASHGLAKIRVTPRHRPIPSSCTRYGGWPGEEATMRYRHPIRRDWLQPSDSHLVCR